MPQIIPFVVTAITTVTSAVVAAGPLAVAAFNAANVIGAGLLANEAFKTLQPQVKSSGAAIEWNADPNAPNRFAFGRVGGAGNIIHTAVYGPDDMFVGFVGIMSASGPIKSWVGFKAEDRHVSFNGSGEAITHPYNDKKMWLDRLRGEQPETRALASPAGLKGGAQMPRWGASYKLSGKAAYMYTLSENSKRSAYRGKVPTGIHTIEGLYCYDPRRDSTYPGGSGLCRLDDPRTWVYSTNAYIHALNWNIGRWEGLTAGAPGAPYVSMKVGGIGARPDGIHFSAYIEAANAFDERAWASAGWPDADEAKGAVLDSFLQAGGGLYAESKGRISCLHRIAPRASIVTITADDTAGTIEYDTATSLLDRINTIRPQYWSEAHGWQMVATDEVTHQDWRLEDGQGVPVTKSKGLDYNYVPGSKQARELAALQVLHTREGIRGTAPLRNYLDLEEGDCFTFEVPDAVLNGQKCIALNVDPDLDSGIINVTFVSETDAKYPFAYGQADRPPPSPSITPSDPMSVNGPLPGEWNIVPRPAEPGGVVQPGLDLTGIISNARAERVLVEHSLSPAGPWTQAYDGPPTTERIEITGLQAGQTYYVAITYFNSFGNPSKPVIYGPYTVGDLIAGGITDEAAEKVVRDVLAQVGDIAAGRDAAEELAEVVIETILNEQQSLEAEAAERLESITGVLNESRAYTDDFKSEALLSFSTKAERANGDAVSVMVSKAYTDDFKSEASVTYATQASMASGLAATLNESKSYTNGQVASAMSTVYTKAETDAGMASTLQSSRAYTDAYKSEANLTFSTKAERAQGDAAAVLTAKAYTDDFKSEASVTYATQASMASGLAATLNESKSYTNGQVASAMSTVYTKAEVDSGRAITLQEAKSYSDAKSQEASLLYATKVERANGDASTLQSSKAYTDDLRSFSNMTFASQSSLDGVSATSATALSTAVDAQGKANAHISLVTDVNGYISGFGSINDGSTTSFWVLADSFGIRAPGGGARTEYISGVWYSYSDDGLTRSMWGRPFGNSSPSQGLVWWTGPASIAPGDVRKSNAYVYISMNTVGGPRFGGTDVPGGGMQVSINRTRSVGSRSGAGSVTTQNVKVSVSGTSDPVSYRWWFVGGDPSLVKGGPDDTEGNWQTTLTASQSKTATWGVSVSTNTESRSFLIEVLAQAF